MTNYSMQQFRNYTSIKFEVPNVNFVFNHCKRDCNADILFYLFLSIIQTTYRTVIYDLDI